MLPVSFKIFLCHIKLAAASKWTGKGIFVFVAFIQMLLEIGELKLFRAALALENCCVQCFLDYIVASSRNEGLSAIWTYFLLTYPVIDAFLAIKLIAFTALDHFSHYVKTNPADKFCNQLLIYRLFW